MKITQLEYLKTEQTSINYNPKERTFDLEDNQYAAQQYLPYSEHPIIEFIKLKDRII